MKKNDLRLSALFLILLSACQIIRGQTPPREIINFDENWKFTLEDNQNAFETGFNDRTWRTIDLPHDWSIEGLVDQNAPAGGQGGYYPTGVGWYRKHFVLTRGEINRNNLILFDGVYMNSDVWINGHHLGRNVYGYWRFFGYWDLSRILH